MYGSVRDRASVRGSLGRAAAASDALENPSLHPLQAVAHPLRRFTWVT